jgi:hypothetical protein
MTAWQQKKKQRKSMGTGYTSQKHFLSNLLP